METKKLIWGCDVHLLDEMNSELKFGGLQLTCRLRHTTEQNSLLLTVWKGSDNRAVVWVFCLLSPWWLPLPTCEQAVSAAAFPLHAMVGTCSYQVGDAEQHCSSYPASGEEPGCGCPAIVLAQREESSEPGQLSESLSKSRYARDPWKGGSMSDIWLKHAVLQPSSASVWSPEYHCQLGSNLHGAWESGTLAVSLMASSPLLHWFQICRYLELLISPAWHPFRQTRGDRLLYLNSCVWLKKQRPIFCESKISESCLGKIFNIHGITSDVVQGCEVNKASISKHLIQKQHCQVEEIILTCSSLNFWGRMCCGIIFHGFALLTS